MTKAHDDAWRWLRQRSGDGALTGPSKQQVLASGQIAPFMWSTWQALCDQGRAEIYRNGAMKRIRIIEK